MSPPSGGDGPLSKADTSCLVCRSRKVKCDRAIPDCQNCQRLGISCPQYDRQGMVSRRELERYAEGMYKAAGLEKRRAGACAACRASRHRCSRTRPCCRRCRLRGAECLYPASPRGDSNTADPLAIDADGAEGSAPRSDVWPEFGVEIDSLRSDTLPDDSSLRVRLLNSYFERSHPLRCLDFIHKPSFMRSIDRGTLVDDHGEALLYAMCALGARHIYCDAIASDHNRALSSSEVPGQLWAERARREILANIHAPTLQHLKAMVLLCDYGFRAEQHAAIFILVSFLYRVIRILGLDRGEVAVDQKDADGMLRRQTEIRVVWACYLMDHLTSSGIDKNSCWKDHIPDLPLPSSEESFSSQAYPMPMHILQVEGSDLQYALKTLDLPALMILVVRLRTRVLRLIRTDHSDVPIWHASSDFLQLIERLDIIYQELPERFRLTELNIYALKDKHLLGAMFFLHFLIHSVSFDLTKISLPGFNFPLSALVREAPFEFRSQCQERCWFHARHVSEIVQKGMAHGRACFDDVFCADAAFESAKLQIVYASTVNYTPQVVDIVKENLDTNISLLELMHCEKQGTSPYVLTLAPLCALFGFRDVVESYLDQNSTSDGPVEVTGSAEIDHLSHFSTFRRAKAGLSEARSSERSMTLSAQDPSTTPLANAQSQNQENFWQTGTYEGTQSELPLVRPYYVKPTQPTLTTGLQGDAVVGQDNVAGIAAPMQPVGDDTVQLSMDNYTRAADEVSDYLMLGMEQWPPWVVNNPTNPDIFL